MEKILNLLVDCTYIKGRCDSVGINLYAINFLKGLAKYPSISVTVLLFEDSPYLELEQLVGYKLDFILIKPLSELCPAFISHKLDRILRYIPFEKELERRRIDRVFTPFLKNNSFNFPLKYGQIATLHDLQELKLARQTGVRCYLKEWFSLRRNINNIPHIITISRTIQQELLTSYNRKSTLIYNSIPIQQNMKLSPIDVIVGKKYILDVNSFYRHKNAETLIRAYDLIKDKIPHKLYLKGSATPLKDYEFLKDLVRNLRLEEKVILDVKDHPREELAYLIAHADLFVSPSRWEGFGFTPIEAAIFKVPVLISNIDTLMEVTRGKITSFDPDSPQELAEKMLSVLSNPPSEEELSAISSFFMKEYSIERQTKEFVDLLLDTNKV